MKILTDFQEFMSYVDWHELSVGEKRLLYEIVQNQTTTSNVLFKIIQQEENIENMILTDCNEDYGLLLTPNTRNKFSKWLEDTYMYGEDGESYLSWLEEIQKENENSSFTKKVTIHMLPMDECRIIKKISIAKNYKGKVHFATILYERTLTENYNFKSKEVQSNDSNIPHDELDKAIFSTIQTQYPDALVFTESQFFDSEKRRKDMWFKSRKNTTIYFGLVSEQPFDLLSTNMPVESMLCRINVYSVSKEFLTMCSNQSFMYSTQDIGEYNYLKNLIENTLK
jgi:hypothetical protein